ncbi:MAG: tripartite tricarboxylate transporter TctB family protein [Alphaproteobacteria bacterium]|nr:tripartite tricarboxylate transporter TctB family protein [Alphaproteobacteria bacterium]
MTRNRIDVTAGLVFLGIGVLAGAHVLTALEIGTPGAMGPGFFPLTLCGLLVLFGLAIIAGGRLDELRQLAPINPRALVAIVAAPVVFGMTLRGLGFVPALVLSCGLSVTASRQIAPREGLCIVVAVTAFCVAVFHYGIGMAIPLLNPAFFG